MALTSALSAQNLTDIRSGIYQVLQFACVVPNTLVVQFQPSGTPSTTVFAEITVGTVASGSMSNIKEGQTVIFSTSTDYQATETFRTRVRKVSGTTVLYVGENSQALTTGDYITVIDTYEVQEKLRRDLTRLDWDITFRKLRPIETALQSAYVLTNGDVTWSETASPVVMDADAASISTHAWSSSNSNDTLDSGGATATPTFTLQANNFRWLRYTFTDNLGLSNYRVIPVWTVGKDYNNAYILSAGDDSGELANVQYDAELGWTCSISAYSGVSTLLNRTLAVVASDEWYNGRGNSNRQSIRSNINFVGYLQTENTNNQANDTTGRRSDVSFTIESFGHQLARHNVTEVTIIQKASSATAWDEIQDPTPGRMASYRLTEFSTASNLMAISLPSDDTSFVGDDLTLDTGKLLDDLRFIGDTINAEIQFDITGKLDLCRDLNYLDSTARNAAATVATLTPADFVDGYSLDFEYGYSTSQVTIVAGSYDSSNDVYELYEAVAPAEARYIEGDPVQITSQVLTTDNTQAQNLTEIAQIASNALAYSNPTYILRATLPGAWLGAAIPDVGAWWKMTLATTDTARGKAFSTSDRWQLVSVDYSTNSLTGTRDGECTWRLETESTGASVRARPIVNDPNSDIDFVPAILAPFTGGDLGQTDGNWYDSQDPQPPSEATPPGEDCELLGVRNTSGGNSTTTSNPALNGETIKTIVRGSGMITSAEGVGTFDFTTTNGGFTNDVDFSVSTPGNQYMGVYTSSVGWEDTLNGGFTSPTRSIRAIGIRRTYSSPLTNPSASLNYDATEGITTSLTYGARIVFYYLGSNVADTGGTDGTRFGIDETLTLSYTGSVDEIRLYAAPGAMTSGSSDPGGSTTFKSLTVSADTVYADAFYYWTTDDATGVAFGTGYGLQFKGADFTSIPPYNPSHEYELYETGVASGVIDYSYDTTYTYAEGEPFSLQILTCFLGVP